MQIQSNENFLLKFKPYVPTLTQTLICITIWAHHKIIYTLSYKAFL